MGRLRLGAGLVIRDRAGCSRAAPQRRPVQLKGDVMRRLLIPLLLLVATHARALDAPIAGETLTLRWNANLEGRLVFVSKDPTFLFPEIGSADDPGTGSPAGAFVWLFPGSPWATAGSVSAPGGSGWTSKSGRVDTHRWSNPDAPSGPSLIRSIVIKRGRTLKVVSKVVPISETPPFGRLAIRIDIGSQRNCAVFEAETIRRDEPFRFTARHAARPSATDCDSAINGSTTTTTMVSGSTTTTTFPLASCGASEYPTCGGACPPGEMCGPNADFESGFLFACACFPPGITPCAVSGYPICGGGCLGGNVCQAFNLDVGGGSVSICACIDPTSTCGPPPPATCGGIGACPPGQVCYGTTTPSFLCGCG